MTDKIGDINTLELLIQISKDVSSIKTDMANFKESQKVEKENTAKELADIRADFQRDIKDLEAMFTGKINTLQSVQNELVGDVDTLKHAEEKKDAGKWRKVSMYLITALGAIIVSRIPDFISFLLSTFIKG